MVSCTSGHRWRGRYCKVEGKWSVVPVDIPGEEDIVK